ncbi:MAG: aryl-sulfate sulfotransferase [Blautia sp.]|nr:aryl-sulfate sulfotransferase [Blautia sp.]
MKKRNRFKWIAAFLAAGVLTAVPAMATETPEEKPAARTKEEMDARFAYQDEILEVLKEEQAAKYPMEEAQIIVDPFELSPLTAMAIFETEEESQISVTVKGKDEASTVHYDFPDSATSHCVPIYGLYADTDNEVEMTATKADGTQETYTYTVTTDVLMDDISLRDLTVSEPDKMAPGFTFVDCPHINGNFLLAIDSNADIRWYLTDKSMNGCLMLTHLKNGNLIVGTGEKIPDAYNNLYGFYEVTPMGQLVRSYQIYGAHHDVREKENGNLLVAASKEGRESQNDYIVELDRNTSEVVDEWDFMEIIPMNEYDTQPPYTGGLSNWMHNNAVWYDEASNDFIVSGRHQNMILRFNAETREIKWIFSGTVFDRNENLLPYKLTPIGDDFEYPTSQHASMITPEGDLLLFDNRNFDIQDEEGNLDQEKMYSRGVRYHIDEENMTIEEVWQYGKEQGNQLYSSFSSDIDYLGEDHYLIDFGGMYQEEDGTSYDHILTDSEVKNASGRNATIVEINNDEIVFQVKLYGNTQSNSYKAERKDIYQNAKEIQLGE